MHQAEFLRMVTEDFESEIAPPVETCRAVLATLSNFISEGEVKKIMSTLPADLRYIWS